MANDSASEKPAENTAGEDAPDTRTWLQRAMHEARETILTIAVFVPFWLVFSTFVYELRSIPSESMVPALQVGDRVAVAKFAYGYNRNSIPFSMGKFVIGDDPANPTQSWFARVPERGDVVVFQHPHSDRVMIKRVVGLPGDRIMMKAGRLYINGAMIERTLVRTVMYVSEDAESHTRIPQTATEYVEQLPGEEHSHKIHEFGDDQRLDNTPEFVVPENHVFMMGDNRDNSEDSRAPSGHREKARQQALFEELHRGDDPGDTPRWGNISGYNQGEQAIGFVPLDHLIGRADTVLFTLYGCKASREQRAAGYECATGRLWQGL
jgi:signal peptidase I